MRLVDYSERAVDTAVYPGQGQLLGLSYAALGLVNEAHEAHESRHEGLGAYLPELGDVLWYVVQVNRELGNPMGLSPDDSTGPLHWGHAWSSLGIFELAALVAGRAKKILRDGDPDGTKAEAAAVYLWQIVAKVAATANVMGDGLPALLEANLAKLADRKERGVLGGDGGTR